MDDLRQYLVSIIAAALICAVVQAFQQDGTAKNLIQLVCGLLMSVTIIAPLRKVDLSAAVDPVFSISDDAQICVSEGEDMTRDSLAAIIKSETEAYILDIAAEMGAEVSVDVTVSLEDIPMPSAAVIRGSIPSQVRERLQEALCTQLGIAKENLTWIG